MKANVLEQNFLQRKNWIQEYFLIDTAKVGRELKQTPEHVLQQKGEARALELFHSASKHIPAYAQFLKKNKINPQRIKTISDFNNVPWTDKKNYIDEYSEKERQWRNVGNNNTLIASSSGTTGTPHLWPRGGYQEYEAAILHELLYTHLFNAGKKSTLVIIGFPMGVYVSGVATLLPSWLNAQKGLPLTIVTTGNNKDLVLSTVKNSSQDHDQVLLIGHPFFIKDVLETGKEQSIHWKKLSTKLMLCSEGFSEEWRSYIANLAGANVERGDIISVYGSSELLLKAFETPLSIALRRQMSKNEVLLKTLTHTTIVPNLFQYNPLTRFIQTQNKELLFTAATGNPLIRFNLHDTGMIIPHEKIKTAHILKYANDWQLPMVAMWGRSDHTMVLYAANIYPEHIHAGLSKKNLFQTLTGKFTLVKKYLKSMDEKMEINVELRPGKQITQKLKKEISEHIFNTLKSINLEYRDATTVFGKKTYPLVTLLPYQDKKYFKPGLKPQYIQK